MSKRPLEGDATLHQDGQQPEKKHKRELTTTEIITKRIQSKDVTMQQKKQYVLDMMGMVDFVVVSRYEQDAFAAWVPHAKIPKGALKNAFVCVTSGVWREDWRHQWYSVLTPRDQCDEIFVFMGEAFYQPEWKPMVLPYHQRVFSLQKTNTRERANRMLVDFKQGIVRLIRPQDRYVEKVWSKAFKCGRRNKDMGTINLTSLAVLGSFHSIADLDQFDQTIFGWLANDTDAQTLLKFLRSVFVERDNDYGCTANGMRALGMYEPRTPDRVYQANIFLSLLFELVRLMRLNATPLAHQKEWVQPTIFYNLFLRDNHFVQYLPERPYKVPWSLEDGKTSSDHYQNGVNSIVMPFDYSLASAETAINGWTSRAFDFNHFDLLQWLAYRLMAPQREREMEPKLFQQLYDSVQCLPPPLIQIIVGYSLRDLVLNMCTFVFL